MQWAVLSHGWEDSRAASFRLIVRPPKGQRSGLLARRRWWEHLSWLNQLSHAAVVVLAPFVILRYLGPKHPRALDLT